MELPVVPVQRGWSRRWQLLLVVAAGCCGVWMGWRILVSYRAEMALNEQGLWLNREMVVPLEWVDRLEDAIDCELGLVVGCRLGAGATVTDLSPLSEFPALKRLCLDSNEAVIEPGAAALQSLSGVGPFRELEHFYCQFRGPLPERFYRSFEHSPRLQSFAVCDKEFDDRALKHLANCRGLEYLGVEGTQVHRGLNELSLTKLMTLSANGSKIDSAGLEGLRNSRELRNVWISGTEVGDEGMSAFSSLPELRVLALPHTRVTRGGLERLMQAPKIWLILATDTGLTVDDAIELTHDRDTTIVVGSFESATMVESGNVVRRRAEGGWQDLDGGE
ncbi:hypothetical protein AYO47_00775 [Planctomyces sp. SCGC AG-212-M04]|nr:hypothetical protein AYO47_00775 [Planctomyces sp. SCGC AG-212-M04]